MLFNQSDHSATLTWQAMYIGARAKSLVAVPGFSGRVLAVFPDAVYLSGRDGEILWLCREGVPLHRRGILLPFPLHHLHPGDRFWVEAQRLQIGDDLAVDLSRAVDWIPEPRQWEIGPFIGVNDLIRRVLGTLAPNISGDGPGREILSLSCMLNGWSETAFLREPWHLPLLSMVSGLMTHCIEDGLSDIETRGRDLVGLGPGLTPCGDDFLGGLLFAAYWLREAYPGRLRLDTQSISGLMHWAKSRTHPISHVILGDLAVGQGPEPLHRLLGLLLKGGDLDGRTIDAVDCLLKVGHTTGWYMLAGLLTGLLSADEKRNDQTAHRSSWVKGEPFRPDRAIVH